MADHGHALRLFTGDSEMAGRMREFDWSQTAIGPVETWSPALRMQVQSLLVNRFPLLLWWGPTFCSIYNDAYAPILGAKHPWALGRPVRECWSEIWEVLKPLIETPFNGGPPTWIEDFELEFQRHGYLEEAHFTVAYSPVPDETAPRGIGGVIATVHEISGIVFAERRVAALRDLGSRAGEARTAEQACAIAAQTLGAYSKDLPFILLYLIDAQGQTANLAGAVGVPVGEAISPRSVTLSESRDGPWPLGEARRTEALTVVDLAKPFPVVPRGPWSDPPHHAVVMAIPSNKAHEPAGLLVAGLSARLKLDEHYADFLELLRTQLATAITNARAYEEEKKRAEALAELDRAKTAFFSNVSHEFRTPLTLMLGPLQDMLAAPELGEAHREFVDIAHRNGLRLLRLVNTLLDFSRIEAGRAAAIFEETDVARLTEELASVFRSATERVGLALLVRCEPIDAPVFLDRDMWEKIVLNLLSNAFKFTFQGAISVSLTERAGRVELTVQDSGVGIPADELPHVFERFHRVQGTEGRTHEGTGIGLALVRELVKLHGGEVEVRSTLGQGSTFTVMIPTGSEHLPHEQIGGRRTLASTAVGAAPYLEEALRWLPGGGDAAGPPRRDDRTVVAAMRCSGARLLVADDNADMRDYLRTILGQYWSVDAVADGRTAWTVVQETPPDLMVCDVMMPGLDGFELLKAIRNNLHTRTLPVILLSARAGEEAAIEGLEAGADAYLVKPFSARELIAYVSGHLQLQRLRREAQTALHASEQKFAAAFSQSPLALTVTSLADGRLVEVNHGFTQLSGYTAEEAIGRTIDELNLWMEPERRTEGLEHLREGGSIAGAQVRFRTKDGDERIGVVGSTVIEANGRPHVLSSVVDVTTRVRAEALLEADLQAFTRLHELGSRCARRGEPVQSCLDEILDAAIAFTEADRGNIQLLDVAAGVLEIAAQRGFAEPFLNFFAGVERGDSSACGAAIESGDRVLVEDVDQSDIFAGQPSRMVLREAGVRAVQSTPLVSSAGNVLGMISTHFSVPHRPGERALRLMDLLARQAADYLERNQAEKALRQRTEQFETLVNQSPLGVYLVDAEFRIQQVNPTALPVFGDIPDLIGRNFDDVMHRMWTAEYAEEIIRIFHHTLETGESYATAERQEYRIDRRVIEQYEWRVDRITLPDGRYGVVCYFRDISAQVRAREQLVALNASLRDADRRKDEFLAMLGHELRNPLSSVRNAVAIASLDESQRVRALEIARRQTEQLGRLIDDLLDVARVTQGRISLRKDRIALAEVMRQAIDNTRSFIESRGILLNVSIPAMAMPVEADSARLEQVLVNLLTNAGKYTDAGGQIWIAAECDENEVAIHVRDTGIGIKAEVLPGIWDLFAQGDRSLDRSLGGLGVGLTVTRRLVELHGGRVEAYSEGPGKGSEFIVTLPLLVPTEREATHSTAMPIPQRSVRILLVEDNPDAAESMRMLLELLGHRVRVAADGIAALDAARANVPDVMLVDIGLPGVDGYEVARRIRKDPALKDVVMVALTGYGRDEDKQAAMAAGFDYHLVKPVNPDALSGLVSQLHADERSVKTTLH